MNEKGSRLVYVKVVINLIIMAAFILFCFFAIPRIIVYFMPFFVAWIISLIANPMVRFFETKLKIKRKMGTAVVIIAVIAAVVLGGYFLVSILLEQLLGFFEELPMMWKNMESDFDTFGKQLTMMYQYFPKDVQETLDILVERVNGIWGDLVGQLSMPTIEAAGNFVKNVPSILIGIIMCLLSSYFFVADKEYLPNILTKILPLAVLERVNMVKRSLKRAVGGYFKAQLKIEVWMYLLLGIGFWILGVRYAFIIAIGVAFLDLLPFFGTGTVLLPWAVIKLVNADYRMVFGLLIIWGVGQLFRQLIQPKIVGDSVGLAPIPTLVLLYLGYRMGSVIGMILAVPIGIILLNMYEEGVFDTTVRSIQILYAGACNFRRITEDDMEPVRRYQELEQITLKERKERQEKKEKEREASAKK